MIALCQICDNPSLDNTAGCCKSHRFYAFVRGFSGPRLVPNIQEFEYYFTTLKPQFAFAYTGFEEKSSNIMNDQRPTTMVAEEPFVNGRKRIQPIYPQFSQQYGI
jgi:hypothetical protein